MCGIVGFISKETPAARPLANGLRRLEYRGYDSAGMALESPDGIRVFKQTGKVAELEKLLKRELPAAEGRRYTIGIAHTRWATHGLPTKENAHPHVSDEGRLALVHNGIIENYASLRAGLEKRGVKFVSQTDTEVLAHLAAHFDKGDFLEAMCETLHRVEGTYGVAVISARHPGEMIVARKGSPLVIGVGEKQIVVASDVSAIVAYTRQVIYLKDGDVARITPDGVDIRSLDGAAQVSREVQQVDWDIGAIEKGGYEHFMLKEIFEQPDTIRNTIRGRLDPGDGTAILSGLNLSPRELAGIRRLVVIGCGTSLHAGMVGKYLFESLADTPTSPEQAAEFRYCNPIIGPDDWVIALSQSGETADTIAAVRESIRKGALVTGLCNVVGSTIAREAGRGVYLHAGPEISVASTKAFTAQVTALLMTALKLGRTRRLSRESGIRLAAEIAAIPERIAEVLKSCDAIAAVAKKYAQARDMFFIGRGILYPTALEGALKIKEVAYVHAEGYQAAELKHGPIALLGEETPVVALLADIPGKEKTLGNVQECRARNAPVVGIVTEGDAEAAAAVTDAITIPRVGMELAPIVTVVALQLFAYHVARLRGCEIDQPRNLAKSVTVE